MINLQNMAQAMSMMNGNPRDAVLGRLNLPQGINLNDPNAVIQCLVDSGRMTQNDADAIMQMASNPMFARMFMK